MKFVIDNIKIIVCNLFSFDNLVISALKKKIIIAFAKILLFRASNDKIDDFMKNKSQDLITFLRRSSILDRSL